MTEQQIEDLFVPVRVSTVLLAEPLRFYYQAVTEVPALRDRALDALPQHQRAAQLAPAWATAEHGAPQRLVVGAGAVRQRGRLGATRGGGVYRRFFSGRASARSIVRGWIVVPKRSATCCARAAGRTDASCARAWWRKATTALVSLCPPRGPRFLGTSPARPRC